MDRRHLVRANHIRLGSELDEHLHNLDVAVPGGVVQGGVLLVVQLVNVVPGVLAVADVGFKLLKVAISRNLNCVNFQVKERDVFKFYLM